MTSEERIEKVEKLLKKATLPDSKTNEILKEILNIETDTIHNAIDSAASFEIPYILIALESVAKVYRTQLAYYPKLQEIYSLLKFEYRSDSIVVAVPKPRSKKNDK